MKYRNCKIYNLSASRAAMKVTNQSELFRQIHKEASVVDSALNKVAALEPNTLL